MKVINKLKKAIYKFYSFLCKNTYDLDDKHEAITQEEADALYDLIDSYMDDDSGK